MLFQQAFYYAARGDLCPQGSRWRRGHVAAADGKTVAQVLESAIVPRFEVLFIGEVVADGFVNMGGRIELPFEAYTIRITGLPDADVFIPEAKLVEQFVNE